MVVFKLVIFSGILCVDRYDSVLVCSPCVIILAVVLSANLDVDNHDVLLSIQLGVVRLYGLKLVENPVFFVGIGSIAEKHKYIYDNFSQ